jgi:hypothetical protein
MWFVIGGWSFITCTVIAWSIAVNARPSTSALLLAIWAASAGIVLLLGLGAPGPTVAELLHATDMQKDERP